jgi:regulator of protease activity HflC (stomatin/prohibitin superfamily)
VHPSVEVVDAFRSVSSAFEEKSKLIDQAEAYRNEQIALARGQALKLISDATGTPPTVAIAPQEMPLASIRLRAHSDRRLK